jgi:predicted DNA-binding ribbon-helix-helix protein
MTNRSVIADTCGGAISLEPPFWEALGDIAAREGRSLDELCAEIEAVRPPDITLTAAIRVFCVAYFHALGRQMSDGMPPPDAPQPTVH